MRKKWLLAEKERGSDNEKAESSLSLVLTT
jgi:hypothetical protein